MSNIAHDGHHRRPRGRALGRWVGAWVARLTARLGNLLVSGAWAVTGMLCLALMVLVANRMWQDYRRGISEAEQETLYMSTMLAEHLGRSVGEVMLMLETMRQELDLIRQLPYAVPDESMQALFEEKFFRLAQLEAIALFDAEGNVVLVTGDWPGPLDEVRRQPFFQRLGLNTPLNVPVGPPVRYGSDGRWRLAVSQRLDTPEGAFGGAIVAILDPDYYQTYHQNGEVMRARRSAADEVGSPQVSDNGASAQLTFLQAGSIVLAWGLAGQDADLPPQLDRQLFPGNSMSERSGLFEAQWTASPAEWVVGYRRLPLGELVVGAAIAKSSITSAWLRRATPEMVIGGVSLFLLVSFTWFATRQIGQRIQAEGVAAKAESTLVDGVESLFDGFVLYDSEGRLIVHNARYREIYAEIGDVIVPGALHRDILRAAAEKGVFAETADLGIESWIERRLELSSQSHCVSEHKLASGQWIEIAAHRTRDGGRIGIHADITERKQREAAVQTAREAAEQASRTKSEFLAMISHELRTPLNAVIGFSELIKAETFGPIGNEKYLSYAEDINASGNHLLQIINDILDLSRAEAGKLELADEEIEVRAIVRSCLRIMEQRAEQAGVSLETGGTGFDLALRADPRALKQMLFNLVSNAVKFTPRGGRITVGAHLDDDELLISVADTGIGIAAGDIPKVLAPFEQVDGRLARRYAGTGLGLPLVKHLIERHGGHLEIDSDIGAGTTMALRFPKERVLGQATDLRGAAAASF